MNKLVIVILLFMILSKYSFCQDNSTSTVRELYITNKSLGPNLGFQYKKSLNEKLFYRLSFLEINLNNEKVVPSITGAYPRNSFQTNSKVHAGIEKRINLEENSCIFYGVDLIGDVLYNRNRKDDPTIPYSEWFTYSLSLGGGIGIGVGYMVKIKRNIYFSAEIEPEFLYSKMIFGDSNDKTQKTNFQFNTNNIRISLVYRWHKMPAANTL